MAEETTSTASDQQLSQIINQLLADRTAQPAVDPNTGPSSREGRTILSLLGEGLGGGAQYGSATDREQGGLSALGALGSRMLQASDWSVMPHTFGSILGQGLDAARGNLGHTQAVSAAQHYAARQLAHEQQQDQIARLKEALPYLQLQEQQRAAVRARELLKPESNTDIGKAGTTTTSDALPATPELAPVVAPGGAKFQVAATVAEKFQGLVNDLEANGYKLDPATSGGYNKRYIAGTHTPSNHAFGTAIDINWAKNPQGGSASDLPPDLARKLAAKHGLVWGGDWSGKTRDPMHFEVPRQRADAAPEDGTVQAVGGDVVPTGTVIPPSPPGSDADVADIKAGMVGAGADPDTLAPGPGSSPMARPGAVVTAQAGGQPPPATQLPPIKAGDGLITHPGTYSEYRAREFVPPPATEDFNPGLTPQQQGAFANERKALDQRALVESAKTNPDLKVVADIRAGREELKAKIQMAAQEKAQKAALAVTKYNETQDNAIRPRYEKEVDAYKAAAQANLTHSQTMEQKDKEGEISRLNTREGSFVESNKIVRDMIGKDAVAASGQVQSLEGLQALSDNVGDKNATLQSLANVKVGGTTLLNHLASFGIVPKGDAGPIQMLQSGISGAITQLRAGVQMGALSDRDLSFIESQGPSLYEDQGTRTAVIRYLQQAAKAKMRFNTIYQEQMARPNMDSGTALEKTREIMDAKHPIVPQMTPEVAAVWNEQTPEAKAARAKWARENSVKQNMLVRQPDGSLMLLK
jgi:hypothetical protein